MKKNEFYCHLGSFGSFVIIFYVIGGVLAFKENIGGYNYIDANNYVMYFLYISSLCLTISFFSLNLLKLRNIKSSYLNKLSNITFSKKFSKICISIYFISHLYLLNEVGIVFRQSGISASSLGLIGYFYYLLKPLILFQILVILTSKNRDVLGKVLSWSLLFLLFIFPFAGLERYFFIFFIILFIIKNLSGASLLFVFPILISISLAGIITAGLANKGVGVFDDRVPEHLKYRVTAYSQPLKFMLGSNDNSDWLNHQLNTENILILANKNRFLKFFGLDHTVPEFKHLNRYNFVMTQNWDRTHKPGASPGFALSFLYVNLVYGLIAFVFFIYAMRKLTYMTIKILGSDKGKMKSNSCIHCFVVGALLIPFFYPVFLNPIEVIYLFGDGTILLLTLILFPKY